MRTGPGLHYWNLLTPSSVLRDTGTLTAQLTQLALRECGSYLPSYQIMPGDSHTSPPFLSPSHCRDRKWSPADRQVESKGFVRKGTALQLIPSSGLPRSNTESNLPVDK